MITKIKTSFLATLWTLIFISPQSFAETNTGNTNIKATVSSQVFEMARKNDYWKVSFITGEDAQIVFMTISPTTNPKNEIGMETHKFDQVIFIVQGNAKTIINGQSSKVKSGDMIFVPEGISHNIVNLNTNEPLKIISVYLDTDMPAKTIYQKKSDAPQE